MSTLLFSANAVRLGLVASPEGRQLTLDEEYCE